MDVHSASPRATISFTFSVLTVLEASFNSQNGPQLRKHCAAEDELALHCMCPVLPGQTYLMEVFRKPFLTSSSIVSCKLARDRMV